MNSPTKIQAGTFAGSYTAPKRRRWIRGLALVVIAALLFGLAVWLIGQSDASRQLDKETYEAALTSSEGVSAEYLDDVQRNARFQKHAGITMDAYLKNPHNIENAEDKYQSAQLLGGAFHHAESLRLYEELIESSQINGDKEGELLERAMVAAASAQDRPAYDAIYSKYSDYLKNSELGDDYIAQSLEMFRWQDEG